PACAHPKSRRSGSGPAASRAHPRSRDSTPVSPEALRRCRDGRWETGTSEDSSSRGSNSRRTSQLTWSGDRPRSTLLTVSTGGPDNAGKPCPVKVESSDSSAAGDNVPGRGNSPTYPARENSETRLLRVSTNPTVSPGPLTSVPLLRSSPGLPPSRPNLATSLPPRAAHTICNSYESKVHAE